MKHEIAEFAQIAFIRGYFGGVAGLAGDAAPPDEPFRDRGGFANGRRSDRLHAIKFSAVTASFGWNRPLVTAVGRYVDVGPSIGVDVLEACLGGADATAKSGRAVAAARADRKWLRGQLPPGCGAPGRGPLHRCRLRKRLGFRPEAASHRATAINGRSCGTCCSRRTRSSNGSSATRAGAATRGRKRRSKYRSKPAQRSRVLTRPQPNAVSSQNRG